MGIGKKFMDFIAPEEPVVEEKPTKIPTRNTGDEDSYEKAKDNGFNIDPNANTVIFLPTKFGDSVKISEQIMAGRTCVINFERIQPAEHRIRIIDYLAGIVFAKGGAIRQVNDSVFVFSASNNISSEVDENSI